MPDERILSVHENKRNGQTSMRRSVVSRTDKKGENNMIRTQLRSDFCGEEHGPYALGVKMGNLVFTTQIGTDKSGEMVAGGIKEQTKALMENAKAVLTAAGAGFSMVGKVTIYIKDINMIPDMNSVYKDYFTEGDYPARCCTQCVDMVDGCLVEMEFVAVI